MRLAARLRLPRAADGGVDPVFWLIFGQLVMFIGVSALFPIVPLYVARRGGGSLAIALFIAGPLVANTLVQLPAGRLTDRIGRRPVLLGSRTAYSVLGVLLFLDVGPLWLLAALRLLQGACAGAYVPALRAAIADLTRRERRGERFAQLQAAEMVGMLVGPLLGGLTAIWSDNGVFLMAAIAVLFGVGAMSRIPETKGVHAEPQQQAKVGGRARWRHRGIVVPSLALFAVGTMFSMYDVVWPQYLSVRGFGPFVIGLTISVYAIPILVLARPVGRLSDRADRRLLLASSLVAVAACAVTYPALRMLAPIIVVGMFEASAVTAAEPTLFAVISDSSDPAVRGRAMGLGGLFQFAGSGFGAGVLGGLYGVDERIPFYGGAAGLVAAAVLCAAFIPARRRHLEPALPVAGPREAEVRT